VSLPVHKTGAEEQFGTLHLWSLLCTQTRSTRARRLFLPELAPRDPRCSPLWHSSLASTRFGQDIEVQAWYRTRTYLPNRRQRALRLVQWRNEAFVWLNLENIGGKWAPETRRPSHPIRAERGVERTLPRPGRSGLITSVSIPPHLSTPTPLGLLRPGERISRSVSRSDHGKVGPVRSRRGSVTNRLFGRV